eukprot:g23926.t1
MAPSSQEGGRLQLEKHLRASSAVQQLYRRVGSEAPEATALAGRVKADMEAACQKDALFAPLVVGRLVPAGCGVAFRQQVTMGNLQMTLCNKVLSCDYSGVSETLCSMGRSVRGEASGDMVVFFDSTLGSGWVTDGIAEFVKQIEWKPRLSAIHGAVFLFFMTVVPGRFVLPHHAQDMQLALRVVFAPMEGKNSLKMGDEFLISNIKKVPGWEPLSWRQERDLSGERVAQQHATGKSAVWPSLSESRFARPMRHWSVEAYGSDGKGGVRSLRGLLQVAHLRKDRELEQVKAAVHEISAVADYARRFNHHLDGFDGEVPTIRVATSMACFVLDGIAPDVVDAGDTAVLTLFDEKEVTKFVFEGSEDFVELPHSFFHFVLWNSGGQDLVADLQGAQHEDEFILVDPVLLKTGDLDLSQLLEMATSSEVPSRNKKRSDPVEGSTNGIPVVPSFAVASTHSAGADTPGERAESPCPTAVMEPLEVQESEDVMARKRKSRQSSIFQRGKTRELRTNSGGGLSVKQACMVSVNSGLGSSMAFFGWYPSQAGILGFILVTAVALEDLCQPLPAWARKTTVYGGLVYLWSCGAYYCYFVEAFLHDQVCPRLGSPQDAWSANPYFTAVPVFIMVFLESYPAELSGFVSLVINYTNMITKVVVGFTALIKGLSTWADLTEPETYEVWNVGGFLTVFSMLMGSFANTGIMPQIATDVDHSVRDRAMVLCPIIAVSAQASIAVTMGLCGYAGLGQSVQLDNFAVYAEKHNDFKTTILQFGIALLCFLSMPLLCTVGVWMNLLLPALVMIYCKILPDRRSGQKIGSSEQVLRMIGIVATQSSFDTAGRGTCPWQSFLCHEVMTVLPLHIRLRPQRLAAAVFGRLGQTRHVQAAATRDPRDAAEGPLQRGQCIGVLLKMKRLPPGVTAAHLAVLRPHVRETIKNLVHSQVPPTLSNITECLRREGVGEPACKALLNLCHIFSSTFCLWVPEEVESTSGSGAVIATRLGLGSEVGRAVLTAAHVIADSRYLQVQRTNDRFGGEKFRAVAGPRERSVWRAFDSAQPNRIKKS